MVKNWAKSRKMSLSVTRPQNIESLIVLMIFKPDLFSRDTVKYSCVDLQYKINLLRLQLEAPIPSTRQIKLD